MIEDKDLDKFLDEQKKWKCIVCGACCVMARCRHYNKNDKNCLIYETRPQVCRTENFKLTDKERARQCFMMDEFVNMARNEEDI